MTFIVIFPLNWKYWKIRNTIGSWDPIRPNFSRLVKHVDSHLNSFWRSCKGENEFKSFYLKRITKPLL